jgi:outer membrane protein assembly factor BamD
VPLLLRAAHLLHRELYLKSSAPFFAFPKTLRQGTAVAATWVGLVVLTLPGCMFHRHKHQDVAAPVAVGDQPDKILFGKAMAEIKKGRYDVGRLTLQTLINTYPDSEFLSKAKLGIADSYYQQGGISGLTQSEVEYKDFITFFPTAPEAPEAQYRVAMSHFRMMGKADRDTTEARLAEMELKEFLLKYPDSPVMPRVKGRLREVQQVLAEGDYEIADFYYQKGSYPAASSRLKEIVEKYPNYSGGDQVLWYLGQSLEHLKKPREAAPYYGRILAERPLSPFVPDAKKRLEAMNLPLPKPTKAIMARAEADAAQQKHLHRTTMQKLAGVLSGVPDASSTLHGPVVLGAPPPSEAILAKEAATGATPSGNTVSVQPVGDASLQTGKPIDIKPEEAPKATTTENTKAAEPGDTPKEAQTPDQPGKKKKSLLKRIIKPF